jgi:hypothetical protein
MFPNNSADSMPAAYLTFLDDLLNVLEEGYNWGQAVLSCLYFNLCRSYRLHSRTSAPASDVVVDTIPDRETEVNHYYSLQWKKSYFVHILLTVQV